MRFGSSIFLVLLFSICAQARAEELEPIQESEIMGQASTEELGIRPRKTQPIGGVAVDPFPREQPDQNVSNEFLEPSRDTGSSLGGRRQIPAVQELRELELEESKVGWSFGIGTQYFMQREFYPIVNLQMALGQNASVGLLFTSMGGFDIVGLTSGNPVQVSQGFFTLNLNSERGFRGLWLQGGAGATLYKVQPVGNETEGPVLVLPTISGTLGWRWKLPDANGSDDAVSISASVGLNFFYGQTSINGPAQTIFKMLPVARVEFNFGW